MVARRQKDHDDHRNADGDLHDGAEKVRQPPQQLGRPSTLRHPARPALETGEHGMTAF